jgi:hypothetical protein
LHRYLSNKFPQPFFVKPSTVNFNLISKSYPMPKTYSFEEKYPHLSRFIEEIGWIQIGEGEYIRSFVRAYDFGGTVYQGKPSYSSLEAAFQDLEAAIKKYLEENGI